jgi:hypothetical protein
VTGWQLLVSVLLGLAINECSDVSPWCARRLVHWSAHRRFTDSARADARAEELTALIDDRPGKLFKLFTALGFAAEAVIFLARRAASRQIATSRAQRADAALDSGTDTRGGLLAGIMKDPAQARWCRLLVGASIASFVLQIMVGLVPFTFLFFCLSRGLSMMAAVAGAGMMAPGLIIIRWWRRRVRRRQVAWIRVVGELMSGDGPMRLVLLVAVWFGNVALFSAGIPVLLSSLRVWGVVAGTGVVALMLAEWGRRKAFRTVMVTIKRVLA